ncbi:MAG: site-specific integrase [Lachnospiraceae bacterium]|nr:site-specific integrase [Lachnospiraceae bacterium]
MATAQKLPSGSWRCQVYSHTEETLQPDGTIKKKRIYKSFTSDVPGPKGKRLAEQAAAEWAAQKENTYCVQNITFGEALDRYIESRESVLSPRTIMDYKRIRAKELNTIMDIKIALITQEDIQRAVNLEAQIHSPKTVRNSHGLISAVMRTYRPNFALNTALPKKVRPDIYIPSENEIRTLLDVVSDTPMELPVLLAAFGPMRRGEICALTSDDIKGNVVHVCKNMVLTSDHKWIIKSPKSYAGDRYIDYPEFVSEKWKGKNGRIVTLNPNEITDRFNSILKRAGLTHFRFHDLRHYSASIQHALGIPDSYIMQRVIIPAPFEPSDRILRATVPAHQSQ